MRVGEAVGLTPADVVEELRPDDPRGEIDASWAGGQVVPRVPARMLSAVGAVDLHRGPGCANRRRYECEVVLTPQHVARSCRVPDLDVLGGQDEDAPAALGTGREVRRRVGSGGEARAPVEVDPQKRSGRPVRGGLAGRDSGSVGHTGYMRM